MKIFLKNMIINNLFYNNNINKYLIDKIYHQDQIYNLLYSHNYTNSNKLPLKFKISSNKIPQYYKKIREYLETFKFNNILKKSPNNRYKDLKLKMESININQTAV